MHVQDVDGVRGKSDKIGVGSKITLEAIRLAVLGLASFGVVVPSHIRLATYGVNDLL